MNRRAILLSGGGSIAWIDPKAGRSLEWTIILVIT